MYTLYIVRISGKRYIEHMSESNTHGAGVPLDTRQEDTRLDGFTDLAPATRPHMLHLRKNAPISKGGRASPYQQPPTSGHVLTSLGLS